MADISVLAEQLVGRVGARLPQAVDALRRGEGVRMQRQTLTLLFIDPSCAGPCAAAAARFAAEVRWLAARHGGLLDGFAGLGTLVAFEHATAAIDMALDLQHTDLQSRLRVAVTTASCVRLCFEHAGRTFETVLGADEEQLARTAASGDGGIRLSPSTYALVREALQPDYSSTLGAETEPGALLPQAGALPASPFGALPIELDVDLNRP